MAILATLALLSSSVAQEPPAIGAEVAAFGFTDRHYLERTVDELGEARATVVVFTTVECPLAGRYLPRLADMERRYRDRGVRFLAINVGPDDSVVETAEQALTAGADFPFGKDFDGDAVRALGVERTPEVVVLDAERVLRYRGRVDDQYRFGGVRPNVGRADLEEALEDVLAGREVRVPTTPVDGCVITPSRSVRAARAVDATAVALEAPTWGSDVAAIFEQHCIDCHHEAGSAPFSLQTYDDASAFADMISEVVEQERMPPWFASERFAHFDNRRALTAEEKRLIVDWVAADAPLGDPAAVPDPPVIEEREWIIPEPDLVLETELHELPADGYVPYRYSVLPWIFREDTWIEDIQILPDNGPVLHHANLVYFEAGKEISTRNFITGQVPGGYPMDLEPGMAVLVPGGSVLALQIHFVTTGRPEECRIRLGLRFPRDMVERRLRHKLIENGRFRIPPGDPNHLVAASHTIRKDITALGLFSHMHLRGKDMTFTVAYPDGEEETLLVIPNYSFDWQLAYRWEEDGRRFPAGTTFGVEAHFDNSAFNPYNPDPSDTVRYGPQTFHEMMMGFLFFTVDDERLEVFVDPESGVAL